jgi:hypothetical protein
VRVADAPEDEHDAERRPGLDAAIAATRAALGHERPVLQAHLAAGELLAIADLLEPRAGGWFLWEVKASTETKPIHDWDLAFQLEVARRAGLDVVGAGVMHLDREYVRHGALDVGRLIVRADRTPAVAALADAVRAEIAAQLEVLALAEVPEATPGSRCKGNTDIKSGDRPSDCGHLAPTGHCGAGLPAHWVGDLRGLRGAKAAYVASLPEPAIELLDPDRGWTPSEQRMIRAVQQDAPVVDAAALRARLDLLEWPVAYVDFEFDPGMAVPRFDGSWPYARLPFQWSMHVQPAPGAPLERPAPFLHVGDDDPRRPFLESLLDALPEAGSVVVHSKNAEQTVLKQLGQALGGELQRRAAAVVDRLYDTIDLAQAGYYHPGQRGSYSIKKLAPVLVGRGYEDLAVQDGMAAVVAWKRACAPGTDPAERERLRTELLAYCGRDTELMHELIEAVRALVD